MRNRERLVLSLSMVLAMGVMGGLLFVFSPSASANDDPIDGEQEEGAEFDSAGPPPGLELPAPPHDFFTLYPAGKGDEAQSYEELLADEMDPVDGDPAGPPEGAPDGMPQNPQEAADAAALWAETGNGHAVHTGWANVSKQRRAEAKAKKAAHLAGTQALDELGVK